MIQHSLQSRRAAHRKSHKGQIYVPAVGIPTTTTELFARMATKVSQGFQARQAKIARNETADARRCTPINPDRRASACIGGFILRVSPLIVRGCGILLLRLPPSPA